MRKTRLDLLITELGLTESRSMAQRLVMAGEVLVNGHMALKPSQMVAPSSIVEIVQRPRFVSRGGEKLEAALISFKLVDLTDWVCADLGSSTGGFTDCLLSHNAKRVYSVDVGYGQLNWKLRNDPRVILMERTNARNLKSLPEWAQLITVDVSFISLRMIFRVIPRLFGPSGGVVVALIKPQFEAGRADAGRGEGVIKDKGIHRNVLHKVLGDVEHHGLAVKGLIRSPLIGPKGNVEFLAHLVTGSEGVEISRLVDDVLDL